MAKFSTTAVAVLVLFALLAGQSAAGRKYQDNGRNYKDKVEEKVRKEVEKAIQENRGIGAALLRLVFHDCFVNGCDGSVLLDYTPTDGANTEKKAANNIGLGGFDVIDRIKDKVRKDNVSCAEIVVLAGRDAVDILSGGRIRYNITRGVLLDGVASSAAAADAALPTSDFDFGMLKSRFASGFRNLDVEDLVVLSGAHSIGVAHLSSYAKRLSAADTPDFQIDPSYRAALRKATPPELLPKQDPTVHNNARDESKEFQRQANYNPAALGVSPKQQVLDNSYYHNTLVNKVLFKSDWVLRTNNEAAGKLIEYRDNPEDWNKDFATSMAKLSSLPAQGGNLEVRDNCRFPNSYKHY